MEKENLLYQVIELVVLCIPIGGLIWKAAKQAGKIEQLETKTKNFEAILENIKHQNQEDIEEIKNSLNLLNINFAEIRTSLSFIQESIKNHRSVNL